MGPTKASRLVNKRSSKVLGEWPDKDVANARKSKKRKLSDMLDSQWSKEELKQFYEAFRKYGKNWKKVAGAIRNRSVNMVESLYNLNRAYLSLPEGTATAAGFTAMMTDHYNNLDGSDCDHERNDASKKTRKPQKYARGKFRPDMSKGSDGPHLNRLQHQSAPSNCRCMVVKNYSGNLFAGSWPRVVGKRTPRVTVMCDQGDGDNIVPPSKHSSKPEVDAARDEGAHVAAFALVEASQGGGSPLVTQTSGRRAELIRSSPVWSVKEKGAETEIANSNYIDVGLDDDCLEGTSRRMEAVNGVFSRDTKLLDIDGVDPSETQWKVKRFQGKRPEGPGTKNCQFDDAREASSVKEKGLNGRNFKDETYKEVSERKTLKASQGPRENSHQLFLEDESSTLDALQILADLSLNVGLQASVEYEPSIHVDEQNGKVDSSHQSNVPGSMSVNLGSDNFNISAQGDRGHSSIAAHKSNFPGSISANPESDNFKISSHRDSGYSSIAAHKSNVPGSVPANPESDDYKILVQGDRGYLIVGVDAVTLKEAKLGKDLFPVENAFSDAKQENCPSINKMQKGMQKSLAGKIPEAEMHGDSYLGEFQRTEPDPSGNSVDQERELDSEEERGTFESGSVCFPPLIPIFSSSPRNFQMEQDHQKFSPDINCIPLNPCENMPGDLGKQNGVADEFCNVFSGRKPDGCLMESEMGDSTKLANPPEESHQPVCTDFREMLVPNDSLHIAYGTSLGSSSTYPWIMSKKQAQDDRVDAIVQAKDVANEEVVAAQYAMCSQPCMLTQIQAREADIKAIAELTRALDKKEALLKELRHTNDDVSAKRKGGDLTRDSKHVIEQYNMVLRRLNDANNQVSSTLFNLRQRNTYHKNSTPRWFMSMDNSAGPCGPPSSSNANNLVIEDSSSHVVEIVVSSRQKAKTLVDAAVLAMSSLKEGEDAHVRIREALDSADNQPSGADSSILGIGYSCPYPKHGESDYHYQAVSCAFNPMTGVHVPSANEAQSSSELISACVATFLMIQATSERRYPPAEVARVLDDAVKSVQPCCSQNLPIYRDIEECMGFIKTQMLALVATPSTSLLTKISV